MFRETGKLEKNEIGVCKLSFTDRIALDRFREHKSLGELILIDRVSFMTSACGVIEQFEQDASYEEDKVSAKTRSAAMGQQAVTVVFRQTEKIGRSLLYEVEKQLILEGRYSYLLVDDGKTDSEELAHIVDHLNGAGIVVLLLQETGKERTYRFAEETHVVAYAGEDTDRDGIASFVKRISSYDYDLSDKALYI